MTDSRSFYDGYVERQLSAGINERHHAIMRWLRRAGLKQDHRVLEIGSGVGTLTQLLAEAVAPSGSVTGLDLSPRSIDAARARLKGVRNVTLTAIDVFEAKIDETFDVIVLPDVIEHVPLERHAALFAAVGRWVRPQGFVLLNYPNPHYRQWCREHRTELLQAIDQPIQADVLLSNVPGHLYLDFYETYSIWIREGDYVVAVLRPVAGVGDFTSLPGSRPSLSRRAAQRINRVLR